MCKVCQEVKYSRRNSVGVLCFKLRTIAAEQYIYMISHPEDLFQQVTTAALHAQSMYLQFFKECFSTLSQKQQKIFLEPASNKSKAQQKDAATNVISSNALFILPPRILIQLIPDKELPLNILNLHKSMVCSVSWGLFFIICRNAEVLVGILQLLHVELDVGKCKIPCWHCST